MKKHASLLFFLALALLAGCNDAAGTTTETNAPDNDVVDTTAAFEEAYALPEADFGGREIKFYVAEDLCLLPVYEEGGSVLDDAIYLRNRKVEEKYNCKFVFTEAPGIVETWDPWIQTCEASILADDNAIDIAGGYGYRLTGTSVTSGLFQNMNDLEAFDFSQQWWPQHLMEAANIGNKLFFCQGHLEPSFYHQIYVMVFDKKMCENLKIENLYDLVNDGKWTYSKFREIALLGAQDLNGNATIDEEDQYGFAIGRNMAVDAFNDAFNIKFVKPGADGMPELLPLSEKLSEVYYELNDFFASAAVQYNERDKISYDTFRESRTMLMAATLHGLGDLRSVDHDFGIIPYPKWNEDQDDYYTYCALGNSTAYCIPVTADGDVAATILEALAYYGYQDILPEYYERVLKGQSTRDNESEAMLDIIFNNVNFDFTQVYSFAFGDERAPSMLLRVAIRNENDISSMFESDKRGFEDIIEQLIQNLK
ncbi:MAG: hypothetical protein E7604_05715 [Ruminococcaceae bacterium]|nr:hypothetical protein [Oscillospiraceae bacterium]